jgi:hypothetical protein
MPFDVCRFAPENVDRNVDEGLAAVIRPGNPSKSERAILKSNQWPSAPEDAHESFMGPRPSKWSTKQGLQGAEPQDDVDFKISE